MDHSITVDRKKCIGCGLCVKDCPSGHLKMKNGKAAVYLSGCMECGHCFAICPKKAINMNHYDTNDCEDIYPMSAFDGDKLLLAMKSRRSIRQFQKKVVESDDIDKILEAGRYSPTGGNKQNVQFTILGSKQDEIEKECVALFRKGSKVLAPFVKLIKRVDIDEHYFFKGAPLVIVVSAKSGIDAGLASAYMELMAESMGLGVLYSGFFVVCAKFSRKIKKILELPKESKVVSCMVIGYSAVTYQRTVPRKSINLRRL
jgi:nitroreductase/NAD-dependent dihydropyrimidine dehydrogenase PreA subunit